MHINKQNRKLDILKLHTLNYIYIYSTKKNEKKQTNKIERKGKKTQKFWKRNYLSLLDETCYCCSKLFHMYKRVGKEY